MEKLLTATKVAQHLDISVPTLNNWYRWYNQEASKLKDVPKLPDFIQASSRSTRYWEEKDLEKLAAFQAWLPRGRGGVMGNWNAKFWGERGKRALKNKALQKK